MHKLLLRYLHRLPNTIDIDNISGGTNTVDIDLPATSRSLMDREDCESPIDISTFQHSNLSLYYLLLASPPVRLKFAQVDPFAAVLLNSFGFSIAMHCSTNVLKRVCFFFAGPSGPVLERPLRS